MDTRFEAPLLDQVMGFGRPPVSMRAVVEPDGIHKNDLAITREHLGRASVSCRFGCARIESGIRLDRLSRYVGDELTLASPGPADHSSRRV